MVECVKQYDKYKKEKTNVIKSIAIRKWVWSTQVKKNHFLRNTVSLKMSVQREYKKQVIVLFGASMTLRSFEDICIIIWEKRNDTKFS